MPGHTDITISVYVLDGAMVDAVCRHLRAKHKLFYDNDLNPDLGPERHLLKLMDLVVGVRCCSHSCSNAIKWGLGPWLTEKTGEDAHITIASLETHPIRCIYYSIYSCRNT